jgi:hypothetical protein
LIIAYYNSGVECEHLRELKEAVDRYAKALSLAIKSIGFDDPLTHAIEQNFHKAKEQLKKINL